MEHYKINRTLMISWCLVALILAITYIAEILKGQRTIAYVFVFLLFWCIPIILCNLWYHRDRNSYKLCYGIVFGYMISYVFTLLTSHSELTYTYIFPLLAVVVLYHNSKLVAQLSVIVVSINLIDVLYKLNSGVITFSNSNSAEIQIASLVTSGTGAYLAARIIDILYQRNVNAMQSIQFATLETIGTIANTLDAKDSFTEGHSRRVAAYAYALAKKLGMSEADAKNVKTIGLLHDIGKIGISDSVLHKPGKLTDDEYSIMKMHPTIGAEILKDIKSIEGLAVGAHYHHERIDGKGYPDGLKGDEIPWIAKIICVADCFDAMNSNRVYRSRFSMEYILDELKKNEGTQFEPEIAEAMISLVKENALGEVNQNKRKQQTKESELDGYGVYLLEAIASKNKIDKDALGSISTADYEKAFRSQIEKKLLRNDGSMFVIDVDDMILVNQKYG